MPKPTAPLRSYGKLVRLVLIAARLVHSHPTIGHFVKEATTRGARVEEEEGEHGFWLYFGVAVSLVVLGGVFAGLTLGLMGQDEIYLQVMQQSGSEQEKRNATKVLRLLQRGKHWVLVTLLLSNVITNETLPIVLDRSLGGGWPAVVSSTVLIVIFGEIIPQSICVRYGLGVGALFSPFVLLLMYLMYPIAYPTAMLLDYILGEDHGTVYKKAGLKTLVTLHKSLGPHPSERLNQDEVTIITAVLDLKEKPVGAIMTPIKDVFTMSSETVLDEKTMDEILSAGYSRIPIHAPGEPTNFVGMLLVKVLITYDPEDAKQVYEFPLATLPETAEDTSCLDIVNFFQEGKSHMVLVSDFPGENHGALGVVTLEDVIEELIGEEIVDESDVYIDVHKAIRRLHPSPLTLGAATKRSISAHYVARTVEAQENARNAIPRKEEGKEFPFNATPDDHFSTPAHLDDITTMGGRGRKLSGTRIVPGLSDEVMAHLTLGPANLADRPRETTSKTVKIKHMDPLRRSEDMPRPALSNQNSEEMLRALVGNQGEFNRSRYESRTLGAAGEYRKKKARTGSLIERTDVVDGIPKTVIETTSSEEEWERDGSRSGSGSKGGSHRGHKSHEVTPLLGPKDKAA